MSPIDDTKSEVADSAWKWVYIAGGVTAVVMIVLFRRCFATELVTFKEFGIFDVPDAVPISAGAWYALLQHDRFLGLVLFDLFDLFNYLLLGHAL